MKMIMDICWMRVWTFVSHLCLNMCIQMQICVDMFVGTSIYIFMPMNMSIRAYIIENEGVSEPQAELKEARVVSEMAWSTGET